MAIIRTYRDTLRKLKKELADNENKQILPYDYYSDNVINLSHEYTDLTPAVLYKKYHKKYEDTTDKKIANRENTFKELILLMPSFFTESNPVIDSDFLTGYYLAKCHINIGHVIISFHAGMSSDGLIRGMYYGKFNKHDWSMLGCDRQYNNKYNTLYVNGIMNPCNIYNKNTVNSINIQLGDKIRPKSLNLYTADINPYTAFDVIRAYLLIIGYMANNGTIIMRIPVNWSPYYSAMITILMMFTQIYSTVKIFNAPWTDKRKYYLILADAKVPINSKLTNNLYSYIECGDDTTPLLLKSFMDDNQEITDKIVTCYDTLCNGKTYNSDNNIETWVKFIKEP